MHVMVNTRLWGDKQAMVLSRIAIDDRGICIGTGAVRPEHFTLQRILQVYQLIFVKSDITHFHPSPPRFKYNVKFPVKQKYDKFGGCVIKKIQSR